MIGVLEVLMEWKWHDWRTRLNKLLIIILILLAIASIYLIISDHSERKEQADQLRQIIQKEEMTLDEARKREKDAIKDREKLQKNVDSLHSRLSQLVSRLEPFLEVAKLRHPDIPIDVALNFLLRELSETKELATRDIPKTLDKKIRSDALVSLSKWRKKYNSYKVILHLDNLQTPNTEQAYQIMIDLLKESLIPYRIARRTYIKIGKPVAPIVVATSRAQVDIAQELLEAFSPAFSSKVHIQQSDSINEGEIYLTINGIPNFFNDGHIELK